MKITIKKKPGIRTKNTLAIDFFYNKQLVELNKGSELFELLNQHGFFPEKYSASCTLRKKKPLLSGELSEVLSKIWPPIYMSVYDLWVLDYIDLYRNSAPKYWGHIYRDWVRNPADNDNNKAVFHSYISFDIEADTLKETLLERLKGLINSLIDYSIIDFARVQCYSAEEMEASSRQEQPNATLVSRQLSEQCLPDLYNISVWGKPYIEFFGRDKLLSAPCYKVEEMHPGLIWMQLSPDVYSEKGSWTTIKDVREKVKVYLNNNAFYDPKLHTRYITIQELEKDPVLREKFVSGELVNESYKKNYKVPQFDLTDIRKPLVMQNVESKDKQNGF